MVVFRDHILDIHDALVERDVLAKILSNILVFTISVIVIIILWKDLNVNLLLKLIFILRWGF